MIERKGVDLLARAFCGPVRALGHVQLDIVGEGSLCNRLMRALALVSGSITFHGFRQWDELPDYCAHADMLCVPSRYDSWGLVVSEGLAAGLPVIATNRMGEALEPLRDRFNGWVAEGGDEESLRLTLEKALALSDQDLTRMSAAATDSVANHGLADGVLRLEQSVAATLVASNAQGTGG